MLPGKYGSYQINGTDESTLGIYQDGLENTVSTYLAALGPSSRHQCDENRAAEAESRREKKSQSESFFDASCNSTYNGYAVEKIVLQISSKPRLGCVERLYRYSKADDTAESVIMYVSTCLRSTGNVSTSGEAGYHDGIHLNCRP